MKRGLTLFLLYYYPIKNHLTMCFNIILPNVFRGFMNIEKGKEMIEVVNLLRVWGFEQVKREFGFLGKI
jgi:hypothetical protein